MGYDSTLTFLRLTMKFRLKQRVELTNKCPKFV